MKSVIIFSIIVSLSALASTPNETIYTSTKTESCKTLSAEDDESDSYEGECDGVAGYKVRLLEGDSRQTINIVTPEKKSHELKFWDFYTGFSRIGEKIEWRLRRGIPVALIARFYVTDPQSEKETSYLMVSKIGASISCVTDVVPASAKQNENARILADQAESKPCKATSKE